MKKIIQMGTTLCLLLVALAGLSGCASQSHGVTEDFNYAVYAAFLELLEKNGFSYEEAGITSASDSLLSVSTRHIRIGSEYIAVYSYNSFETMERDANSVSQNGFSISNSHQITMISWVSQPHWFKGDLIIVVYVGKNSYILNFLVETFGYSFAGYGV